MTKKFVWDENKPPLIYRPGTSDEAIIDAILVNKREYTFPNLAKIETVFDIGANIGVTAVIMANLYPSARVHCFEPEKENFELLTENTKHFTNVSLHQCAVDNYSGETTLFSSDEPKNLGGFSTSKKSADAHLPESKVQVVRMASLCTKFGHPELIKIDCEGAEYNILTDIPQIEKVLWITGELHGIKDFDLLTRLSITHEIQTDRRFGDVVWHFQAAHRAELFTRPQTP